MAAEKGYIDWIALWVLVMGLWPLSDPGHGAETPLSVLDLSLHVAALMLLGSRWKLRLVRRRQASSPPETPSAQESQ